MPTERKNEAIWIANRNRWQINVQSDAKRRTFTSSTPGKKGKIETEKKADAWLRRECANLSICIEKLWAEYLTYIKPPAKDKKSVAGTGYDNYDNYVKHEQMGRLWLLPRLKIKKVVSITQQD